jgi:hypothetical protein
MHLLFRMNALPFFDFTLPSIRVSIVIALPMQCNPRTAACIDSFSTLGI